MAVRLGHLQKGIYLPDSRDEIRDEGPKLGIKVYLLRFVPVDVFKQFFDLRRNGQIRKLSGIIGAGYFALIVVVGVCISWCGSLLVGHLLGFSLFWLGLLILLLGLHVHFNVDLVVLFFGFDFFAVVDVYYQIKRLVLHLFRFHVLGFWHLVSGILLRWALWSRGFLWLLGGLLIGDVFIPLFFGVVLRSLSKTIVVTIHVYLNLNN